MHKKKKKLADSNREVKYVMHQRKGDWIDVCWSVMATTKCINGQSF